MIERGETVSLDVLEPHPQNYNVHPPQQIEELRRSLRVFDQVRDIVVWRSFIVAGHGVVEAAVAEGWGEISATRLPDDWSEERVLAYLAADNETAKMAEPDDAQLAALLEVVDDEELRSLAAGGEERLREIVGGDGDENYTRKIEAPTYEPKGEKPQVEDLFDDTKTRELVEAIDCAEGISEEEREFLRVAAQRHTVLNFEKIADFYAHSGAVVQALMEDSALVIIDFERAISEGFIQFTSKVAQMFKDEYGVD